MPFISNKNYIHCGYFGGLTKDKGADFLIQMIKVSLSKSSRLNGLLLEKDHMMRN